ncbi:Rab11 family GTPase [Achlya hypogyna]|uniref:Rab11 family GTPase n=1 Tax=Achlya hypogyna TaxID=1202772 RepID=A0A1V9Z268_ACHHY|nr:Rab11 family GTPase [Achlya hypogyna]
MATPSPTAQSQVATPATATPVQPYVLAQEQTPELTTRPSLTLDDVTSTISKFVSKINLLPDEPPTLREFLTKFYTERNLPEKLKDIDALVAYYQEGRMHWLYVELDKRYGTNYVENPPCREVVVRRPSAHTAPVAYAPAKPTKAHCSDVVILLGNSGVGKTNLLSRLNKGEFSTDFASTIGVEFLTHVMEIDGTSVKAQIWDTAGQERFHAMMGTYYRKAVGALLVFDVSDQVSFEGIQRWLDQLLQARCGVPVSSSLGNKADVDPAKRAVSTAEAQKFATSHHMNYIETSAKTGANVDRAFRDLLTTVHRTQSLSLESRGRTLSGLDLTSVPKSTSSTDCC